MGEGAGALVIKRAADCTAGKERIYASISGVAEGASVDAPRAITPALAPPHTAASEGNRRRFI